MLEVTAVIIIASLYLLSVVVSWWQSSNSGSLADLGYPTHEQIEEMGLTGPQFYDVAKWMHANQVRFGTGKSRFAPIPGPLIVAFIQSLPEPPKPDEHAEISQVLLRSGVLTIKEVRKASGRPPRQRDTPHQCSFGSEDSALNW